MQKFVELWTYLSATPLFGLTATLVAYLLAQGLYARLGRASWANPVLWTVLTLVGLLSLTGAAYSIPGSVFRAMGGVMSLTGTAYGTYFAGAQFIHFLLGPAVVALGWPLWQRRAELRRRAPVLLVASIVGGGTAAGSAVVLGWLVGLTPELLRSLAPKSVTAPVAMGIAEQLGGIPALAAGFAVVTGMVGALIAKGLFDTLRIREPAVRGFAIGTAAHGIGAAQAMQAHPDSGAYAGLALGMQVLLATMLIPLGARLLGL